MTYTPILFKTVAHEVAAGEPSNEQYLIFTEVNYIIAALPTPAINTAITKALEACNSGLQVLRAEFSDLDSAEVQLRDGVVVPVDVNGVVVEVAVRAIAPNKYRVMFSRIDGVKLYRGLRERIEHLEGTVEKLSRAAD